jgi:hypothetical protein
MIGIAAVAIYWITLVIMLSITFIYGMWKYAVLQKVDEPDSKTP